MSVIIKFKKMSTANEGQRPESSEDFDLKKCRMMGTTNLSEGRKHEENWRKPFELEMRNGLRVRFFENV